MKTIKFDHDYPKLWAQKFGELLAVKIVDSADISNTLREYDTFFTDPEIPTFAWMGWLDAPFDHWGWYKLPKGKLIQLIFLGDKGIPFCTLRNWTKEKEERARKSIGETFGFIKSSAPVEKSVEDGVRTKLRLSLRSI